MKHLKIFEVKEEDLEIYMEIIWTFPKFEEINGGYSITFPFESMVFETQSGYKGLVEKIMESGASGTFDTEMEVGDGPLYSISHILKGIMKEKFGTDSIEEVQNNLEASGIIDFSDPEEGWKSLIESLADYFIAEGLVISEYVEKELGYLKNNLGSDAGIEFL
jgi:hypothetical protein